MKQILILTCAAALLAACGVDGEPTPPEPKASTKPGIAITGRAEVGVSKEW